MTKPESNIVSIVNESVQVPERRSLSEEAADALRELILLEKLAPGTPVPERDLAEGLGISRTPLKDALRILEVEGLIEYSATRRPRVADPSVEELRDYITVLGGLEALAGEIACKVATDEEIAAICDQEQAMYRPGRSDMEFFHKDMDFHSAIVAAARNAPLQETHRQYNARLWRARFMSSRHPDRRDNTFAEHARIAKALSQRDAEKVSKALRRHFDSTIENIIRIRAAQDGGKDKAG